MPTQELKDFVEERLRAYDPGIDLSAGSPAQYQVVDPIVSRFQPDPFEMDIEKFLYARLTQEFPDVNFREGSGIYDLMVKSGSVLFDPISREVRLIKQAQSFARPDLLAATEADALAANLFVPRATGGLAVGNVRLYFNAPVAITVSAGNACYTADGLRFIPTYLQSISAESMLFNQSGSLYYFDINVTAEQAGTAYNVSKETIIGITNLNAAVLVKNLEKFSGGLEEESTEALVSKAQDSVTERSLVTSRGGSARLRSEFPDLANLQIVGMFDTEMNRDVITGGDLGPAGFSGNDGYTEDDGDGDSYSYILRTRYHDFTDYFGAVGTVKDPFYVVVSSVVYGGNAEVSVSDPSHIFVGADMRIPDFSVADVGNMFLITGAVNAGNVGPAQILEAVSSSELHLDKVYVVESHMSWMILRPAVQLKVVSVLSPTELRVESPLPVNRQALIWSIHPKVLTLSDLPGGIIFTEDKHSLDIQSDQIHVGGATDYYVRGTDVESKQLVITSISDELPLDKGLDLIADMLYMDFVHSPTKDFVTLGVKPGMSLVIESGLNAGTKTILRVGMLPSGATGTASAWLQLDSKISSPDLYMRYKIVDSLDIDLRQPKTVRGSGDDLKTAQLSAEVSTDSAVDFLSLGTAEGDTLEILEGNDKGTYTVNYVYGTGNKNLNLAAFLKSTADHLSWSLYQAKEGLAFPLVRITGVDILDSSQQPTGYTVPYAPPVDARGSSFSNAGRGTKLSTSDAITGIVSSVDMDSLTWPLPITDLGISVNGAATVSLPLTGVVSKYALVQTINNYVPDIAELMTVDGKDYLTLRSGDRWLYLLPNAQNANIGLDTTGEDNRQIKSAGNIPYWNLSTYDLKEMKDVVYVKTGDNIGYLHLVEVLPDRIHVVGFDEVNKTVRFMLPGVNISVVVGSRSYGKARVYFLEPTSFTVRGAWHPSLVSSFGHPANATVNKDLSDISGDEDPVTYFTATVNGATMRFFPDPDLSHQVIPAPDEDTPNNLTSDTTSYVVSESEPAGDLGKKSRISAVDFLRREIKAGDLLNVTYQPIQGDGDISTINYQPMTPDLAGLTLILSVGDNPARTVTFTDQLTGPDDVAQEINLVMGQNVAYIETIGTAKYLRLEADEKIIFHSNSTSKIWFWNVPPVTNLNNYAAARRAIPYKIYLVGKTSDPVLVSVLSLLDNLPSGQSQHFTVDRPGVQRLHSTSMNLNVENGLYYMDVELVSEGVGDEWNLGSNQLYIVTNYESDGYRLEVVDKNLSFSEEEDLRLILSHRLLTVGSSDKPEATTALSGQNIQVNYERSPLTASVQAFARSELDRVLTASILARHLQPHYLNFTLNYRGGSASDVVMADVQNYLNNLGPNDRVESSDIQNLALKRSANYVQNPLELIAIVHGEDRQITVDRSEDYVTKGRLATFFPGTITVSRETTTAL